MNLLTDGLNTASSRPVMVTAAGTSRKASFLAASANPQPAITRLVASTTIGRTKSNCSMLAGVVAFDCLALLVRGELRPASQLHVARLLAAGVIQILRDMLDPLRRLAQRNRHLLGPARGGSRRSLQPREFGFELADAGVRLRPFVGESNRRHDDETLVADLAETLPQRGNLGIDQLREVAETDFLAFVAGHPVDPAVDHKR